MGSPLSLANIFIAHRKRNFLGLTMREEEGLASALVEERPQHYADVSEVGRQRTLLLHDALVRDSEESEEASSSSHLGGY